MQQYMSGFCLYISDPETIYIYYLLYIRDRLGFCVEIQIIFRRQGSLLTNASIQIEYLVG